eukprot:scaffold808_cov370-Prasinococcus_capsulatus_cf.AAC.10
MRLRRPCQATGARRITITQCGRAGRGAARLAWAAMWPTRAPSARCVCHIAGHVCLQSSSPVGRQGSKVLFPLSVAVGGLRGPFVPRVSAGLPPHLQFLPAMLQSTGAAALAGVLAPCSRTIGAVADLAHGVADPRWQVQSSTATSSSWACSRSSTTWRTSHLSTPTGSCSPSSVRCAWSGRVCHRFLHSPEPQAVPFLPLSTCLPRRRGARGLLLDIGSRQLRHIVPAARLQLPLGKLRVDVVFRHLPALHHRGNPCSTDPLRAIHQALRRSTPPSTEQVPTGSAATRGKGED